MSILVVSCSTTTTALFTGHNHVRRRKSYCPAFLSPISPSFQQSSCLKPIPLQATLYAGPWDESSTTTKTETFRHALDEEEEEDDNEQQQPQQPQPSNISISSLSNKLSSDYPDHIAALARMAVAFSPPPNLLDITNLEHVHIVDVDSHHIELGAVVCDGAGVESGCVTVLVPIEFPEECGAAAASSPEEEECVLENVSALDEAAGLIIRKRMESLKEKGRRRKESLFQEEEEEEEEDDDDEFELEMNKPATYPSWWVPPRLDGDLVRECDNVKTILNSHDFHEEVAALIERILMTDDGCLCHVEQAVVTEVGPAGFCFRAKVYRDCLEGDVVESEIRVLEVNHAFHGGPAMDSQALREAVLGAISEIHVEQ